MSKNTLKALRKILKEDVSIIFFILVTIITFTYVWIIITSLISGQVNTPSVGLLTRSKALDSDGDLLPDLVEGTEENPCSRGELVPFPEDYRRGPGERNYFGKCTETDPFDKDTDNDGLTDTVEDALGTNPTSWINPGYIYIFWIVVIGAIMYNRVTSKPSIKEYEEFEELAQSRAVSGKEGVFAYGGGSSVFAEKSKDFSTDERKQLIESDPRYRRMMGEGPSPRKGITRSDRIRLLVRKNWYKVIIALFIGIIVRYFVVTG